MSAHSKLTGEPHLEGYTFDCSKLFGCRYRLDTWTRGERSIYQLYDLASQGPDGFSRLVVQAPWRADVQAIVASAGFCF